MLLSSACMSFAWRSFCCFLLSISRTIWSRPSEGTSFAQNSWSRLEVLEARASTEDMRAVVAGVSARDSMAMLRSMALTFPSNSSTALSAWAMSVISGLFPRTRSFRMASCSRAALSSSLAFMAMTSFLMIGPFAAIAWRTMADFFNSYRFFRDVEDATLASFCIDGTSCLTPRLSSFSLICPAIP